MSGKTVMPAMIDVHTHLGYRKGATFLAENFTRETILDQLEMFAARGVVAVASAGTDRSDITLRLRDEPHAGALVRTAWRGLAPPDAGPNPPMRDAPFGVSTVEDAQRHIKELAARKADYVKIWADDRNGTVPKMSPALARAIIDEAHQNNLRVFAHIATLADAKDLLRAGLDGFLHPVRDRDVDAELLALLRDLLRVFVRTHAVRATAQRLRLEAAVARRTDASRQRLAERARAAGDGRGRANRYRARGRA